MNAPAPLVPWSSPADGAPGWQILAATRQAAGTLAAATGGEVQPADGGRWPVTVREPALEVTALAADDQVLTVALPACGAVLAVRRRPWGDLATLTAPDGLPADGVLTVRRFIIEDRMGQLLAALVPVFEAASAAEAAA